MADGFPIDVSLKNKNEATTINNSDVMWCNANVTKFCEFLYDSAILNRVHILLFNTPYEGSHTKAKQIDQQIKNGKYKAIVCLWVANTLFQDSNKDKWDDIDFIGQTQKDKIDELKKQYDIIKKNTNPFEVLLNQEQDDGQ